MFLLWCLGKRDGLTLLFVVGVLWCKHGCALIGFYVLYFFGILYLFLNILVVVLGYPYLFYLCFYNVF